MLDSYLILVLVAQGGGKMISPTFKVKSLTHAHYHVDIIKL